MWMMGTTLRKFLPALVNVGVFFFLRWVRSIAIWPSLAVRLLGSYTCISRSPSVCPYADSMPVSCGGEYSGHVFLLSHGN